MIEIPTKLNGVKLNRPLSFSWIVKKYYVQFSIIPLTVVFRNCK